MLTVQKNRLFMIVREQNISPSWFVISEKKQNFKITVRGTSLTFEIENKQTSYDQFRFRKVSFGPTNVEQFWNDGSTDYDTNPFVRVFKCTFEEVTEAFSAWLCDDASRYIEEQSTPDLWSGVASMRSTFESQAFSHQDYQRFSPEEREHVKQSIERFKLLLEQEYSPNAEQTLAIKEKLDYLKRAVDRLNRSDWQNVAISTVINIAITMSIDTGTGSKLWSLLQKAFGPIIKLLAGGGG